MTKTKTVIHLNKKTAETVKKLQQKAKENKLNFNLNSKGYLKQNSVLNVIKILQNDPNLKDLFKFNEFTEKIDVMKDFNDFSIQKGQFKDKYVSYVAQYIETRYEYDHILFAEKNVLAAIMQVADLNSYNPLKNYMNEAYDKWDKKHRFDKFFPEFLGTEPSPAVELITKIFFYGAVAKVYNPETKVDYVLDLVGSQGVGKTVLLKKITPLKGYYGDSFTDFEDKDNYAIMQSHFINNDDELTATIKSSFELIKKFVTMDMLEYRPPYGKSIISFPKKFVLVRTTNDLYYLKDTTGDRRFLTILADAKKQTKHPYDDLTPEYVQQIWGEAVHLYKDTKFSLKLSEEQEYLIEQNRGNFIARDEVEEKLENLMESVFYGYDFLTTEKIAYHINDRINIYSNKKLVNKINMYMINRLHWSKGRKMINGHFVRGFIKPK